MAANIIEPTLDFDFSTTYVGPPVALVGGAYFAKLMHQTNKQMFIQTPCCLTKQGIIKSGKKTYVDLMFTSNDTVLINWFESLETKCQSIIYSNQDKWFDSKLELDDIESAFTASFKIFKSGRYYLLRTSVKPNCHLYDEKGTPKPIDSLTPSDHIACILEIQGIRFTSRNFQLEIEMKQAMLVNPDPFVDECFIRPSKIIKEQQLKEQKEQKEQQAPPPVYALDDDEFEKVMSDVTSKQHHELSTSTQSTMNTNEEVLNDVNDLDLTNPSESSDLEEVQLEVDETPPIELKSHMEVYYKMFADAKLLAKQARQKTAEARKNEELAYNEVKRIKETYMLEDALTDSDLDIEDFE